jgi:TRAP-type uncharacterized transport system substrate-binding protein
MFTCRDDFPQPNGYQIAETIAERWKEIDARLVNGASSPQPVPPMRIPIHPGAAEYYEDHPPAR